MTSSTVTSSIIAGPILGFCQEDLEIKRIRYKVLSVAYEDNLPTFSLSTQEQAQREILYKINQIIFERFVFDISLQEKRSSFTYTLNDHPYTVKLPGLKEERVIDFCSCNDFQFAEEKAESKEPDHMWRIYQEMIEKGMEPDLFILGGDQGYFDGVFETPLLKEWLNQFQLDQILALNQPFTHDMEKQVELYYLKSYLERFSNQNNFGKTISSVPIWPSPDDHDFFDGVGSYSTEIENCDVIKGIKAIAKKYYYLFQQQSFPIDSIRQLEFVGDESTKVGIVGRTAILVPDTRNHRTQNQVIHPNDWQEIMNFLEMNKEHYDHSLFIFPIPFIYANLQKFESRLRVLNAIIRVGFTRKCFKLIAKVYEFIFGSLPTYLSNIQSLFGDLDLLDDLDDHWMSEGHIQERDKILLDLFKIKSWEKSVLILSGDVHHGCETEVRSEQFLPNENDPYLIKNGISSSIVNKISPIAKLIPIFFTQNQRMTTDTIGRLVKIQPLLSSDINETTIINHQNFLRVVEVAKKGLQMVWYESDPDREKGYDDFETLKQYYSFTPIYSPIFIHDDR